MEGDVKNKSKSSRKRKEVINSNSAEQNKDEQSTSIGCNVGFWGSYAAEITKQEGVASKSDAMVVVIGQYQHFHADQFHKITRLTIGSTSFPENKQDINKSSIIKEFFGGNHMIKRTELDEVYKGLNVTNDKLFLRLTLVWAYEVVIGLSELYASIREEYVE
ncbi:hypothetical protein Scep_007568 [Stephania cephalantha]|uniref:Uncharacterized protein n=1 Tax=Stephania cephalantha TaxID=152367 RepID=A0AAP0PQ63_9MAGN